MTQDGGYVSLLFSADALVSVQWTDRASSTPNLHFSRCPSKPSLTSSRTLACTDTRTPWSPPPPDSALVRYVFRIWLSTPLGYQVRHWSLPDRSATLRVTGQGQGLICSRVQSECFFFLDSRFLSMFGLKFCFVGLVSWHYDCFQSKNVRITRRYKIKTKKLKDFSLLSFLFPSNEMLDLSSSMDRHVSVVSGA